MSRSALKKIISVCLAVLMSMTLFGCNKESGDSESTEPAVTLAGEESDVAANVTETTQPETTTAPPPETTRAETTTAAPDGSSIQNIIDTLESKHFYMAGTMNMTGGQVIDAKATCDGDNYRLEMVSKQMKMTFIYIDEVPYIVNNATNMYVVIDEAAINNMDKVLSSFSSFGVSFSNTDIAEMKSMMSNFDKNMDFSQYIEGGEYSETHPTIDGQEYLCSIYKTEYGTIRIYTLNGEPKILDVYDSDGLRQMNFVISAFIPQILTPITLNGLTKSSSIVNLFTAS